MASAGFVRYTGYDNADIFKNMLIEAYAGGEEKRSVLRREDPHGFHCGGQRCRELRRGGF